MRYVLILLVTFSLNASIVTLPAQAGRLEIRSIPVVRNNPVRHLLRKVIYDANLSYHIFLKGTYAFPFITLGSIAAMGPGVGIITGFSWSVATFVLGFRRFSQHINIRDTYHELKGRQVYYTELRDGKAVLRFGQISGFDYERGMLAVETTHGTVAIDKHKKNYPDSKGISVPDHPDLHKHVSLLAAAEDPDNLYIIAHVSRVYDDGHYEIEIDNKVDYNNI